MCQRVIQQAVPGHPTSRGEPMRPETGRGAPAREQKGPSGAAAAIPIDSARGKRPGVIVGRRRWPEPVCSGSLACQNPSHPRHPTHDPSTHASTRSGSSFSSGGRVLTQVRERFGRPERGKSRSTGIPHGADSCVTRCQAVSSSGSAHGIQIRRHATFEEGGRGSGSLAGGRMRLYMMAQKNCRKGTSVSGGERRSATKKGTAPKWQHQINS